MTSIILIAHYVFVVATKTLELMTNSQVIAGFSDSAITLNRQIVSSAGINFGGTSINNPLDFSRHITLYGGFGELVLRRQSQCCFTRRNCFCSRQKWQQSLHSIILV